MRRFPVHCEMIRVAAADGERRRISVSGFAKARLLWLFRNFSILDFPVLNRSQQQLIARMWQAGTTVTDNDPFNLIGTVDGFMPKLYPSVPAAKTSRNRTRIDLSSGLRIPAILTVIGVLLLGSAILLLPKHRSRQSQMVAAAAARRPVNVGVASMPRVAAEPVPPPTVEQPAPAVAEPRRVAAPPAAATEAVSVRPSRLPDAMALNESSPPVKTQAPPVAVSAKPRGKPEVMIRVSVDREGRASTFHVLQGDRKKISAALIAAKRWHYQPCAASANCEHTVRFTDFGDASTVQVID